MTSFERPSPAFPSFLIPAIKNPFRRHVDASPKQQSSLASPASPDPSRPFVSSSYTAPFVNAHDTPESSPYLLSPPLPVVNPTRPSLSRLHGNVIRCGLCGAHVAFASQIVSKGFTGRLGRAYLVAPPSNYTPAPAPSESSLLLRKPKSRRPQRANLLNTRVGTFEDRPLATGMHTVADISCELCHTKLGWKYIDAAEPAQRYKIGNFILETERTVECHGWEDLGVRLGRRDGDGDGDEAGPGTDYFEGEYGLGPAVVAGEEIDLNSDDDDECEDMFAGVWDPVSVARKRRKRADALRKGE